MTETASPETPETAPPPVLIHGGYYELYQSPAGGLQVRFQRTAYTHPETGELVRIPADEQGIEYLPEIPAAVADAMRAMQETGEPPSAAQLAKIMAGGMVRRRRAVREHNGGDGG